MPQLHLNFRHSRLRVKNVVNFSASSAFSLRPLRSAPVPVPALVSAKQLPTHITQLHARRNALAGKPALVHFQHIAGGALRAVAGFAVLEVTAWTDDGEIMGVRHKTLPIEGVQFHPESILTEHGHAMLKNFLEQRA